MISIEGLKVEFGVTPLFEDVSFVINKKDRIALVGKNGAGKSTMLKILAGEQRPTEGTVAVQRNITVGYLPQVMVLSDSRTVMEEAEMAFEHIFEMQERLNRMNQELADRTDYDSESYQELIERFTHDNEHFLMMGGTNYQAEIERTLIGLGFERTDFNRPTSEFSGGWRMRIELAKLLLRRPDVLLLDEPTNHLDIPSREALEAALLDFGGTMLVVSHDRYFINKLSTRVLSIGMGGAESFDGGYDDYAARIAEQSAEKPITAKTVGKGGEDYNRRKERESELRRTATAIKRCGERINEGDARIANTNAEMSTPDRAADYARFMELTETLGKLNGEQTELMLQWEELENRKAQLEGEE